MNYEIQIFAKDKTKIIRFRDEVENHNSINKLLAWEDFYYALGAVIDDQADKFQESDTLIARLNAPEISFDDMVDVMCEDLSVELTNILTQEEEVSVLV